MSVVRRVALVTGAARGLGAAIAEELAADGIAVAINFVRNQNAATEVRDRILAAGGNAETFRADVTDGRQVAMLYRDIVARFGRLDVLVCNATGPQPEHSVEELSWQDILDQLVFFVKSPLLLAKQVLPEMRRRGYGRIIHIGSEVFDLGVPRASAYVAAKGAQLGLTRSWARELGGDGITVNLVAPGWIPTDRHRSTPAADHAAYVSAVPLGTGGEPHDVASTVAFLASERAKFVTGQRIAVNGGNTIS
ncbi:3-oxoacyl-[acyl-carrier protein] reductase [Tamaricihabitans halophyticus]|uniref:3-oxoacyl-[acyl-carrier protein] reductase n=1 Tax=Tamaricihabitans halophyticus TaxID=1262583 RepID=A0A4R2QP99_9PSEU|nr:SDR family oxidoreductase [Tamaricihabitans halophyticus]TCP50764.1 3-oxoacyl-[acyl-carrier protein] reductase [Tamaricihabitans halophyticus]